MFFLGVDVSKKTLSVVLSDHRDKILWSNKSIPNDETGFKKLVETVIRNVSKKAGKKEYSIAAGMEATGVYGERLAYYLNGNSHDGRIVTYVLNPAAVRAFGNFSDGTQQERLGRCSAYSFIPLHGNNKGTDISMEGTLARRPCS